MRGGYVHENAPATPTSTGSVMATSDAAFALSTGKLSLRGDYVVGLGGGAEGLEGLADAGLMGGARLQVGDQHGPALRVGIHSQLQGSDRWHDYRVSLPTGFAGYEVATKDIILDAGAIGGLMLFGARRDGTASERSLGPAPELGARLMIATAYALGDIRAVRVWPTDGLALAPLDELRGRTCFHVPFDDVTIGVRAAVGFAVCADASWTRAGIDGLGQDEATNLMLGVSLLWSYRIGLAGP